MTRVKREVITVNNDSQEIIKQMRKLIKIESREVRKLAETCEDGPLTDQLIFLFDLMKTRVSKTRIIVEPAVTLRAPWIIMEYFYGDKGISKYDELIITGAIFQCLKIESWIRLVKVDHRDYAFYTIPCSQKELKDDIYFSFCPELGEFDEEPVKYEHQVMIRMT